MAALQEDARDAGAAIAARLDAVQRQIDSVATWSDSQMSREETSGGSCGTASGAGRGPLYNARRSVRDGVASLRDSVTKSWITPVQADLEILRKAAAGLEGDSTEDRQKRFEAAGLRDPRQRAQHRHPLERARPVDRGRDARARRRGVGRRRGSRASPATTRRSLSACGRPPTRPLCRPSCSCGGACSAKARPASPMRSRTCGPTSAPISRSLATYVVSGGKTAGDHTSGGEPITGRDMIALLATIGIDLGLFVLALLDPPAAPPVRRDGARRQRRRSCTPSPSRVRAPAAGAFKTAIARAPGADLEWVRRHFIHHNGASYFVIPNLYSVDQKGRQQAGGTEALAMNQLAGVFDDLKLVTALAPNELKAFLQRGEPLQLHRPVPDPRRVGRPGEAGAWSTPHGLRWVGVSRRASRRRASAITGCSRRRNARSISPAGAPRRSATSRSSASSTLEGLTPLLSVLNEASMERPPSEPATLVPVTT